MRSDCDVSATLATSDCDCGKEATGAGRRVQRRDIPKRAGSQPQWAQASERPLNVKNRASEAIDSGPGMDLILQEDNSVVWLVRVGLGRR